MIFYFYGSSNNITDSKSILTSFSLGNLGQEDSACNTGEYTNSMSGTSGGTSWTQAHGTIEMQCNYGVLDKITSFG